LAEHGLQVEPSKCKAWVPNATEVNPNIEAHVPMVLHGLPVLGTAAQAEHSCLITLPSSSASTNTLLEEDANKRLASTQKDAVLLQQMAQTSTDSPVRYAAWLMLTRSLASRLDFDMRILPAATLTPTINAFTATLLHTAAVILDLPDLTNAMLAQA